MAQYRVVRSCGHEDVVAVSGPKKDRERIIEREANRMCLGCWKAAQKPSPIAKVQLNEGKLVLSVYGAFEIREDLKSRGFQFNPGEKSWERSCQPGEQAIFSDVIQALAEKVDVAQAAIGRDLLDCQEELQNILLTTLGELRAGTMNPTRKAELAERAKTLLAAGADGPAANAWAKANASKA